MVLIEQRSRGYARKVLSFVRLPLDNYRRWKVVLLSLIFTKLAITSNHFQFGRCGSRSVTLLNKMGSIELYFLPILR